MRHQKTKAHIKKKLWDKTHPLSPLKHPDVKSTKPHQSHPTIIYNNNTMDTECCSVRKDENSTYTWDLVRALEWASSASCKTPATFIDSIRPNKQTEKTKNPEMRFNFQQIVSYCLGLRTQNQGLREVDVEPSPKCGSEKINMLKQGRKTAEEKKLYRTAWTHRWIPTLREVYLEPSAKTGAHKTKGLVSL